MSQKLSIVCLLLVVIGISSSMLTGRPLRTQKVNASIERMRWLAGCWKETGAESDSLEQWMEPAAGLMLGVSRTIKNGRVREYEFMRITEENDALVYTAIPSGQQQASFTLINGQDGEFIFENKQHDFPQRIIYKSTNDSLLARIEGVMNGKSRGIDFPMARVNCAGGNPLK